MKKKYLFLLLGGCLMALFSCDNNESDYQELFPEEYHKILYIKDSGSVELELSQLSSTPTYNYSFIVCKAGSNPTLEANAHIEVMSQKELDEKYSIPEAVNYKVLPKKTYSLENSELLFTSEELHKYCNVSLTPSIIKELLEEGNPSNLWVLPLKLVSASDSVNSDKNILFLKIVAVNTPTIKFSNASKKVNFGNSSSLSVNVGAEIVNVSNNQWNFSCEVDYASDATVLLDEYNQNNPAFKCVLMPTQNVAFSIKTFEFEQGDSKSMKDLVLNITSDGLISGTNYFVPIKFVSCTEEGFVLENPYYLIVTNPFGNNAKITLNPEQLSSPHSEQNHEGRLECLVDNNRDTFWHAWYSKYVSSEIGYYFDVKLSAPISDFSIGYTTRSGDYHEDPVTIYLYGSNIGDDNLSNWTLIATLNSETDALPTTASTDYKSSVFTASASFSYLRFACPRSMRMGEIRYPGSGRDGSLNLAEFRLWGK